MEISSPCPLMFQRVPTRPECQVDRKATSSAVSVHVAMWAIAFSVSTKQHDTQQHVRRRSLSTVPQCAFRQTEWYHHLTIPRLP